MTASPREHLSTYLCDHFAGWEGALEIMENTGLHETHCSASLVSVADVSVRFIPMTLSTARQTCNTTNAVACENTPHTVHSTLLARNSTNPSQRFPL